MTQSQNNIEQLRQAIDTIVMPARTEGFERVFLGKREFPLLPISAEVLPNIRYIAIYRVAPISAITHYARIVSFEHQKSSKHVIARLDEPHEIGPLKYRSEGETKAIQGRRYTRLEKLKKASSLDDAF